MKILNNYDFNQNQIINVRLQQAATAPLNPVTGQIYYNTVSNRAFIFNGTEWVGADAIDAVLTGTEIVTAINGSTSIIDLDNLPEGVSTAITNTHTHSNKDVLDATTASFTIADEIKLDGIAEGATANTGTVTNITAGNGMDFTEITTIGDINLGKPSTITGLTLNQATTGTHTHALSISKNDVGLSNVTDDAQVKKSASSIDGNIVTWSGTTGDALGEGYSVETTLIGGTGAIPRADAVKTYVDNLLSASDAMVFKGTLGTGGTITELPTTYQAGWTYKVITEGTYAGHICQIGDLIIATIDRDGTGNLDADWVVAKTNIDGAVTGPASSTSGNFVSFDGTSGKVVQDSGFNSASFATAGHTHTNMTFKYSTSIGDGSSLAYTITHNLNTQDAIVSIRETASPYAMVMTDIEFTTVNTITVRFATAPTAGQYTVTVIG